MGSAILAPPQGQMAISARWSYLFAKSARIAEEVPPYPGQDRPGSSTMTSFFDRMDDYYEIDDDSNWPAIAAASGSGHVANPIDANPTIAENG